MEKELNDQDKAEQVRKENLEKILEPVIINKDLTPDEKVKEISSIIIGIKHEEMFSGPMPPPHLLREYQKLIPDAAERMLKMAEKEQDSQIFINKEIIAQNGKSIEGTLQANKRSQIMAFVLVLLLIIVGTAFALLSMVPLACVIFGTTIAGVAAAFITGKLKSNNKETNEEQE